MLGHRCRCGALWWVASDRFIFIADGHSIAELLPLRILYALLSEQRIKLMSPVRSYILPTDLDHTDTDLALRKLMCGGLAGATSLLFTHPFDVLRRKLQVAGLSDHSPQYNGALDAMGKIIRNEGFWKGM